MAEYVVAQAAVLIVPSLKKFQKQLEIELRRNQALTSPVKIDVEANTKKFVSEALAAKKMLEKDPVNIKFRVLDATKQITEIRYKYEDLSREMKKGLIVDLKIVGLSLLPQLANGLAAANSSMVQLTQTAALLPGLLAGVGSSIAAISTGLGGVKTAFKEYSDGQKNAAQEGLKARNSLLNVQNAYRDLGRSIKDAKRNLEDLNAQLRDAPLDEADAIVRLAEARAEAADRYQKSGLQQQKDALALQRAENDLVNVRLRNSRLIQDVAAANAKGVAGADAVREATDRLSKAQDEASTQTTKLSDSLKELSPNAQAFVQAVTGMQQQWTGFKNAVQDSLFAGLDAEVTRLGSVALPTLQKGFVGIADAVNGNVKSAFAALETQTNQGFLAKIFGDTAAAQSNLSKAFDPFVDSLLRLSAAGTDFLPRLVDGLSELLTRFDNFIVRAEGDGSIERWINQGIDEFKALGNAIINVGSILDSLSQAFTDSGGKSFLQSLESATKRLADFLNTDTGEARLKQFFIDARVELDKWKPLLSQLPSLLANLSAAGQTVANIILPFLTNAATLLAGHPALVKTIFIAYVAWNGILPILKGMNSGIGLLNNSIDFFRAKVDDGGKKTTGFKKKIGELTSTFLSGGGLIAVVGTAATVIATDLASAHDKATQAAQRQRDEVDSLTRSLDEMTGAATGATRAQVGKNLIEAVNEVTGQKFSNLGDLLVDPVKYTDAVSSGNLDAALGMIPEKAKASDVTSYDGGKFWSENSNSLQQAGLTPEIIADAVNGNPDARRRFEDWQYGVMKSKAPPGVSDRATLNWLEDRKLISRTVDLGDLQNSLSEPAKRGAALSGETYAYIGGITQGGKDIRSQNEFAFGKFRLNDGSAISQFGPVGEPRTSDGKSFGVVTSSAPQPGTPIYDQLRNDGVTFEPDGNGKFIVRIGSEAADRYVQRYAEGGRVVGPGSGTSDSILARLSQGEFVVNARSTQQHLPLLEQINGGLPGFKVGGPIKQDPVFDGGDPSSDPGLPGLGSAISGAFGSLTGPSSFTAGPLSNLRSGPAPAVPDLSAGAGLLGGAALGASAASSASTSSLLGGSFGSTFVPPKPAKPALPPGKISDWLFQLPAPKPSGPLIGSAANASPGQSNSNGLGSLLGADSSLEKPGVPIPLPGMSSSTVMPSSNYDPITGSPLASVFSPQPILDAAKAGRSSTPKAPAPKPSLPLPNVSKPSSSPPVPVVHGSGGAPGPGNGVPHIVPGAPARPGPYQAPSSTVAAPAVIPVMPASQLPGLTSVTPIQAEVVPGVTAEVNFGAREAAKYGLRVSSGLREGETGSYHAIGQAGDYSNQVQYGPPTPEMTAFANDALANYAPYISELIYSGVSQNVIDGKLVPAIDMPGSPYTTGQAGYHGDHVHIAWKPGALEALSAKGLVPALGVPGLDVSGSPSNMPAALTPTGVVLPQLSYAPNASGSPVVGGAGQQTGGGGLRLPTPEEYAKYVTESWAGTLQNLVKNAGSIATNFVGSFFGLDLSKITGTANSILGGIDLPGMNGSGSGEAQLPADAGVEQALQSSEFNALPPEYQKLYESEAARNPSQAFPLLDQLSQLAASGAGGVQYDPSKGAEQWRPVVRQALQKVGPQYGITNLSAWEDDIIGQINFESKGNPGVDNLNDTDGKGGTQQVFGLGQFHPETFAAHNRTGGDIHDPVAQIYAMIDYLASPKYGVIAGGGVNWKGVGWKNGQGYASGGKIKGRGSGKSDSIIARVSNGEYIVRAPMASKHMGLLDAINSNRLPGFAEGGMVNPIIPPTPPPAPVPPPITTPTPPPVAPPPDPMGPSAAADAGQPTAPAPVTDNVGPGDAESQALQEVGSALGAMGEAVGGAGGLTGAEAPAGGTPEGDPRSALGSAPQNLDHNKPAVSMGIQAAGSAISGAINTAIQAGMIAAAGTTGGASMGASPAAGAASSLVSGLVSAGSTAVSGAVNILSSLGVGTVTPSASTGGAYGTPLLPQETGQQPYSGPSVVNNWNGGVHTSNNEEFFKVQQRRELQNAAPFLPSR